jgi:hypothetical protein
MSWLAAYLLGDLCSCEPGFQSSQFGAIATHRWATDGRHIASGPCQFEAGLVSLLAEGMFQKFPERGVEGAQ